MGLRILGVAVLGMVLMGGAGCMVVAQSPIAGGFVTDTKGAVAMGTAEGASKVGMAEVTGIIGIAWGDGSIDAAMKNGGITKVHHVDVQSFSILGIYAKATTLVYGE